MNNTFSGIKKNLDDGICVESIRQSQLTGKCDLKTCVQCQKNADKNKSVKLSELDSQSSSEKLVSYNTFVRAALIASKKNRTPFDIYLMWLTPSKIDSWRIMQSIVNSELETMAKIVKVDNYNDIITALIDDKDEQEDFINFCSRFKTNETINKGDGIKMSDHKFSMNEIVDTVRQCRNIRSELLKQTSQSHEQVEQSRRKIQLAEECNSVQSGFVSIENELAPKNSLMPDPTSSDFYKVEAVRHVQEKQISDFSRKKQEAQNKSREAKDEHAKFLASPEGIRRTFEERHGINQKSSYDYEFGR